MSVENLALTAQQLVPHVPELAKTAGQLVAEHGHQVNLALQNIQPVLEQGLQTVNHASAALQQELPDLYVKMMEGVHYLTSRWWLPEAIAAVNTAIDTAVAVYRNRGNAAYENNRGRWLGRRAALQFFKELGEIWGGIGLITLGDMSVTGVGAVDNTLVGLGALLTVEGILPDVTAPYQAAVIRGAGNAVNWVFQRGAEGMLAFSGEVVDANPNIPRPSIGGRFGGRRGASAPRPFSPFGGEQDPGLSMDMGGGLDDDFAEEDPGTDAAINTNGGAPGGRGRLDE